MTGFGSASVAESGIRITIEATSVNRKVAEVVIQIPRELGNLEESLRKQVIQRIARGRVQINVSIERSGPTTELLSVDLDLAKALADATRRIRDATGEPVPLHAGDFFRHPGVIATATLGIDLDAAAGVTHRALDQALDQLVAMRAREGDDLKADFLMRIHHLSEITHRIEAKAADRPARQREILMKRLAESGLQFGDDDEKIAREVAIFADRCCISEEIIRLHSHFDKFIELLESMTACGRALDFLCQEIHREFNTIGSKANDTAVAHLVVDAKTEVEKIREQVQNVE